MIFGKKVLKSILYVFLSALVFTLVIEIYVLGVVRGYQAGKSEANLENSAFLSRTFLRGNRQTPTPTTSPSPTPSEEREPTFVSASWGGPELWQAVNDKRTQLGVNPLSQRDELCTIASIRLNQLLDLGGLDGHEGFSKLEEERPDLEWIFERYSTLAEFLAVGGQTPEDTVSLWENTLGHRKLLDGGEYVWGCIYAQNTFAVAITAF